MDARALAMALPLTARAVARIPTTETTARYPTAPTHAHPASSRRDVVALVCSLPAAFAPARELLRELLRTGAAAEAHGRTLAAGDLGFRTDGPDLALALSFPVTSGALGSSTDGLAIILGFHSAALPPATTRFPAAAQDEGVQGARLRRRLSVVCRAHPLGTAASPATTLLLPGSDRPHTKFSPRLPTHIPRMFGRAGRQGYLIRCAPLKTAGGTDKKEELKSKLNLNIALGCLVLAVKSKRQFHLAVGCVVLATRSVLKLAEMLHKSKFVSSRVKLPEKVVAAAALCLVLGKFLYGVIKETKEFAELVLYFVTLYQESAASTIPDSNMKPETTATPDTAEPAAFQTTPTSDTVVV